MVIPLMIAMRMTITATKDTLPKSIKLLMATRIGTIRIHLIDTDYTNLHIVTTAHLCYNDNEKKSLILTRRRLRGLKNSDRLKNEVYAAEKCSKAEFYLKLDCCI